MNKVSEVYEVSSPSFPDIPLDEQILLRICDWIAVDYEGREFFGHTKNEAMNYCVECSYYAGYDAAEREYSN